MIEFGPIPDARTLRRLNRLKKREPSVAQQDFVLTYPPGAESYSNNYVTFLAEHMPTITAMTTIVEEPSAPVVIVKDLVENPVQEEVDNKSTDSSWTNVSSLSDNDLNAVKQENIQLDLSGNNMNLRDVEIVKTECTVCCVIS